MAWILAVLWVLFGPLVAFLPALAGLIAMIILAVSGAGLPIR